MINFAPARLGFLTVALAVLGSTGHAAVQLATSDCDGIIGINEEVNEGCSPLENFTNYSIDVVYNDSNGFGGTLGGLLYLGSSDTVEVNEGVNWGLTFGSAVNGSIISQTSVLFGMIYSPVSQLVNGDVIATLSFQSGVLGTSPDDDLSDIYLFSLNPFAVFDPATGTIGSMSRLDLQAIPLPASLILMMGGLTALAGLRRRKST